MDAITAYQLTSMLEGYGLAELVPMKTSSLAMQSNWKIYQENSLEPYHTDVVHKTSHTPAPANLSAFFDYTPGDGAIMTTTGFSGANELFAGGAEATLPHIEGLSPEQQGRILFVAVLPSLFLVMEPGSVLVNLVLPHDARTMTRLTFALYPRQAVAAPGFAAVAKAQAQALDGIISEDQITQEALQRGHKSRFTPKGTLSWLETTIPQMNAWLLERYRLAYASLREDASEPLRMRS